MFFGPSPSSKQEPLKEYRLPPIAATRAQVPIQPFKSTRRLKAIADVVVLVHRTHTDNLEEASGCTRMSSPDVQLDGVTGPGNELSKASSQTQIHRSNVPRPTPGTLVERHSAHLSSLIGVKIESEGGRRLAILDASGRQMKYEEGKQWSHAGSKVEPPGAIGGMKANEGLQENFKIDRPRLAKYDGPVIFNDSRVAKPASVEPPSQLLHSGSRSFWRCRRTLTFQIFMASDIGNVKFLCDPVQIGNVSLQTCPGAVVVRCQNAGLELKPVVLDLEVLATQIEDSHGLHVSNVLS